MTCTSERMVAVDSSDALETRSSSEEAELHVDTVVRHRRDEKPLEYP